MSDHHQAFWSFDKRHDQVGGLNLSADPASKTHLRPVRLHWWIWVQPQLNLRVKRNTKAQSRRTGMRDGRALCEKVVPQLCNYRSKRNQLKLRQSNNKNNHSYLTQIPNFVSLAELNACNMPQTSIEGKATARSTNEMLLTYQEEWILMMLVYCGR
jgi:hypothetical protein